MSSYNLFGNFLTLIFDVVLPFCISKTVKGKIYKDSGIMIMACKTSTNIYGFDFFLSKSTSCQLFFKEHVYILCGVDRTSIEECEFKASKQTSFFTQLMNIHIISTIVTHRGSCKKSP